MENTGVQGGKQYIISEKSLGFKLEVGEQKVADLLGLRFLRELVGSTYPLNEERAALLQLQHFSAPPPDSQGMHAGLSSFLFVCCIRLNPFPLQQEQNSWRSRTGEL